MNSELITYLKNLVTDNRWQLFNRIVSNRTRYMTVVIEDIYQSHNASAVLRTCDCFGVQDVHIIENKNTYDLNTEVSMGSDKWLNLIKYNKNKNNTLDTINKLKNDGYRVVATTPHANDTNLEQFDFAKGKFALLFGTELNGLSEEAINTADEYMKIPMYGFTESFNISVSAAIILHHLCQKIRENDIKWQLSIAEKEEILISWLRKSIKDGDAIAEKFLKNQLID